MPVYAPQPCFSASTNGRGVAVAATSTPGTTIHTATSAGFEEIYAWAVNRTAAAVTLTIEFGGTSNSDHLVESYSIPAYSAPIPIAVGQRLGGGLAFAAFCSSANAINIFGYPDKVS